MAGPLDHQINLGVETTYGAAVTPGRTYEWDLEASNHQYDPKVVQGSGTQVGDGAFDRADRSVSVIGQSSGQIGMDFQSKGMGLLMAGCFGNGSSALVGGSGTTYQQLFTSSLAASLLPAQTLQYGIVRSDAAGTVDCYTYAGVTFNQLVMSCEAGGILKLVADWDGKAQTKATALAAATYPSGLLTPYHFGQIVATVGGSVTVPTTTAMASGGTAISDIKSFNATLNNGADLERWVFGGRNQPRVAKRTFELTVGTEYNSAALDDALVNHTTLPVTFTATSDQSLSAGFAMWQLTLPACKVTSPNRPNPQASTPTVEYTLAARKPATGAAVYLALRTADVALN